MLGDYISPDLIQLRIDVPDWQSAVRAAGELLVTAGICEPGYIQAMIDAVDELGPYMVLAPGIALAHARPEKGVLKVGMSIITLSPPVNFGSIENDPVSLVIAFGAVDHNSHIGMLQELALFLMEESNQDLLKSATDVAALMKILKTTGETQ